MSNALLIILFSPFMLLFGTHLWYVSFPIQKYLKTPYIINLIIIANLEFLLLTLWSSNFNKKYIPISFIIITISTLIPPLIFGSKEKLIKGYNGEYFAMARIAYLNIIFFFICPLAFK